MNKHNMLITAQGLISSDTSCKKNLHQTGSNISSYQQQPDPDSASDMSDTSSSTQVETCFYKRKDMTMHVLCIPFFVKKNIGIQLLSVDAYA
jgi:hypothetical protein